MNINQLKGKQKDIIMYMKEKNLNIILLVETWLRPNMPAPIKNASIDIRSERQTAGVGGRGGINGLFVVAKPGIRNIISITCQDEKGHWVLFKIGSLEIALCYFIPDMSLDDLNMEIDSILSHVDNTNNFIIMGDFNSRHSIFGDTANTKKGSLDYLT